MMFMWLLSITKSTVRINQPFHLSLDVDAFYDPNALKFVPMDGYRSCYLVQKAWPSL